MWTGGSSPLFCPISAPSNYFELPNYSFLAIGGTVRGCDAAFAAMPHFFRYVHFLAGVGGLFFRVPGLGEQCVWEVDQHALRE